MVVKIGLVFSHLFIVLLMSAFDFVSIMYVIFFLALKTLAEGIAVLVAIPISLCYSSPFNTTRQ